MTAARLQLALQRLMPRWQAHRIVDIEYLPGGYSNDNYAFCYAGERYVLRLPREAQPFVDRHHEQQWYTRLPEGLAPRPIALDVDTGLMLSTWVEGTLLVDAWPRLSETDLIDYLTTLHQNLPEDPRVYDLEFLMSAYGCAGPGLAAPPLQDIELVTCHNDLNPWNILVTDNGWVTLDWEFVGLNDPLFDLVSLHQGLSLPEDSLPDFARMYLPGGTQIRRLNDSLRAFWLREYAWANHQLDRGNHREEIHTQQATAKAALKRLSP